MSAKATPETVAVFPAQALDHEQLSEAAARRRLRWRLDFVLLPTLILLDTVSIWVRANIGNARIQGLEHDLNMDPKSNKFNVVLSCLWATYIPMAIPSNLILKRVNPCIFLSFLTIAAGIISMCQAFVQSYESLIACRLLIGVFAAGISPGSILMLSSFYSRWEMQRRYAFVWCSGYIASGSGGLLAFALAKLDGVSGLSGWRWIFLVEGLVTITLGIIAKFTLLDWPDVTDKLTVLEKALLKEKMEKHMEPARMDVLDRNAVYRIVKDWKIYCGAALYFAISVSSSSFLYFMPTILRQYGYSAPQAQLHTIPVWVVSAAFTLAVGFLTDHFKRRAVFVFAGCGITIVGYIMLLLQAHLGLSVKYLALIITAAGIFTVQPVTVMWMTTNLSGQYKLAAAVAFQLGWGGVGSIVASNIFLTREAPSFHTGLGVALACIGVEIFVAAWFTLRLRRENRLRNLGKRDHRWSLPQGEIDNMGDDKPDFRFNY